MKRHAVGTLAKGTLLASALSLVLLVLPLVPSHAAEFYWTTTSNLSEEYDDNIFLDDEDPVDDFITLFEQDFTLGIRTEEVDTSVDFSIGYAHYQEREDEGDIRGNIDLSGARDIPLSDRWLLDLDESFTITEDPLEFGPADDAESLTETGEPVYYSNRRDRNRYYRNRFQGELSYRFGEEDEFYFGYGNTWLENSAGDLQDSMEHRPFAGVRYWFNVRHGFDLGAHYTMAEFDQQEDDEFGGAAATSDFDELGTTATYYYRFSPETLSNLTYAYTTKDFDAEENTDYDVHSLSLGLSHQFTETLSASASVGWYRQEPDEGASSDGPNASLSLSQAFENGTLTVTGSMGFREQYFEVENLGASEYRRIRASYGFQVAENMHASLGAGYYENEYLDLDTSRKDTTWYGDASLSYRILERLTATLDYTHQDRDAEEELGDYEVNRVMLRFSIPFEGKPRSF